MDNLAKEYSFFKGHRPELIKLYRDKFVVIKDQKVIGAYDSDQAAYQEAVKSHKLGTFLIQQCVPENKEEVAVFHSRVIFT